MVSARRMLTRCLIRLCHDKFVGTHGKMKVDSAGVRTGVYLHRIQVLWEQKIELSLGARGADCSSCILCFSVMHITLAEMLSSFKFPIRCNLRISGIWDLSVRHVRKCYGTPRPQSAPSPLIPPCGNKRYLCFQVDILDEAYQLSTPDIITIIPIVAAGSKHLYRLIGTARKPMPPSILRWLQPFSSCWVLNTSLFYSER